LEAQLHRTICTSRAVPEEFCSSPIKIHSFPTEVTIMPMRELTHACYNSA